LPDPKKCREKKSFPGPAVENRITESKMQFFRISPQNLWDGELTTDKYDIICLPGGFAPNYYNELGEQGIQAIQNFVMCGGGYVGICAGAYFGANCSCGISLIDVDVVDIENWARGSTDHC